MTKAAPLSLGFPQRRVTDCPPGGCHARGELWPSRCPYGHGPGMEIPKEHWSWAAFSSPQVAHVLFNKFMTFNPKNPDWVNRDRFVLSYVVSFPISLTPATGTLPGACRAMRRGGSGTAHLHLRGHPPSGHVAFLLPPPF